MAGIKVSHDLLARLDAARKRYNAAVETRLWLSAEVDVSTNQLAAHALSIVQQAEAEALREYRRLLLLAEPVRWR